MPLLLVTVLIILVAKTESKNYSIQCEKTKCSYSSHECPPWQYCNTQQRFCSPCSRCIDGAEIRQIPPGNCQDPLFCNNPFDSRQDYACPRLKVKEGHRCSGICSPCSGFRGYFLGTTCRVNCDNGDSEVFSCIFLNELAQWNVSRMPPWIEYEPYSTPTKIIPTTITTQSSKQTVSTTPVELGWSKFAIIVVGVLGAVVVLIFSVSAMVWMAKTKRRREKSKTLQYNIISPVVDIEKLCKNYSIGVIDKPGEMLPRMIPEVTEGSSEARVPGENSFSWIGDSRRSLDTTTTHKIPVEHEIESIPYREGVTDDDDGEDNDNDDYDYDDDDDDSGAPMFRPIYCSSSFLNLHSEEV